jgi:hypothetical protein
MRNMPFIPIPCRLIGSQFSSGTSLVRETEVYADEYFAAGVFP